MFFNSVIVLKTVLLESFVKIGQNRLIKRRIQNLTPLAFLRSNTKFEMVTEKDVAVKYLDSPDKSDYDKKLYKSFLLPNGLHAVIISDPSPVPHTGLTSSSSAGSNDTVAGPESASSESTGEESSETATTCGTESSDDSDEGDEKLAAVALLVGVGSFSEPREYQGLAHFLEHMIFMGSKKYPAENAFDAHIKKCGGSDNAHTESERTVFYFEVPEEHLDSSMDYFSALLKAPLMHKEAMTRERDAVESEFQQALNEDEARFDQLLASLASNNYPHATFSWGNLKSLKKSIENSDDKLYESVHEFCKRHYSAHRMHVCVQARLPIDELESMVIKHFVDVPSNGMSGLDTSGFDFRNAFVPDFHEKIYFMKPVQNVCKIDFTWVLPPSLKYYRCKPDQFVGHLLGHEGEGSLCAYLRKNLWGLAVVAGVSENGFDDNNIYTLFNLCLHLTDDGFSHLDDVLKATFAYIKLLAQPEALPTIKSLYEEQQKIEAINFRYEPERAALDNVQFLVQCSHLYPPKDLLTGNVLYFEYNESEICEIIGLVNEFKFNLMIASQQMYDGITNYDKQEQWFGTEYTTRPMPERWIKMWEMSEPVDGLHLPLPNEFVTNNFKILFEENEKLEQSQYPLKLVQKDVCELWFRADDKFLLPEAYMHFYFISPLIKQSAKNDVLCSLLVYLVKHHVAEKLYPAMVAGLQFHFHSSDKGIILKVNGFNEKLHKLVELIVQTMVCIKDLITSEELNVYKTQLKKSIFNFLIKPQSLNRDIRLSIIHHIRWSHMSRYKVLDTVTLEDMLEFAKKFPEELYIQSLIQGNLSENEAADIMDSTLKVLNCNRIENMKYVEDRSVQLPQGSHYIRCQNLNEKNVNTIVTNFYQIGPTSVHIEAIVNLLMMFVSEPLFDTLRTKEQLGYHVGGSIRTDFGVIGYLITLNSQENKHPAHYIDERIEAFRTKMLVILDEMEQEEFDHVRNSLIKLNQVVDMSLEEEVSRNWGEITNEDYLFDRRRREVEELRLLTKQDVVDFCLNNERNNFRKLSVQVIGNTSHLDDESNVKDLMKDQEQNNENKEFMDLDSTSAENSLENLKKKPNKDGLFETMEKTLNLKFLPREGDATTISDIDDFKESLHVYPITKLKDRELSCNKNGDFTSTIKSNKFANNKDA